MHSYILIAIMSLTTIAIRFLPFILFSKRRPAFIMYLGKVAEIGTKDDIFKNPQHPYTKALFSAIPVPDPTVKMERIVLEGSIPSPANPPAGCKFHTRCPNCMEQCKREIPQQREIEPGHFLACHFPEKKLDENGNYLFETPGKKA